MRRKVLGISADKPAWERALIWLGSWIITIAKWVVTRFYNWIKGRIAANKTYRAQMKKWAEEDKQELREFEHDVKLEAKKVQIAEKAFTPGANDHPLVKFGRGLANMGRSFQTFGTKMGEKAKTAREAREERLKAAKEEILRKHGLLPKPSENEEA